jgi:hypothetical protein
MKVIRLDHRHNLKRKGYDWAFRFNGWTSEASTVEHAVKKLEGFSWNNTFWGKPGSRSNGFAARPYYVGVKSESTLTMVLLSLG